MHGQDARAQKPAPRIVQALKTFFARDFQGTPELLARYRRERAESLSRVNSVFAWVALALIVFLAFFSDPKSFPEYAPHMLQGRMYAIVAGALVGILSLIPALRRYGVHLSFLIFAGAALQMAHLSAVMNNHPTDLTAWLYVNIVFCGIYPIPLLPALAVVLISFAYYVPVFLAWGYEVGFDFWMLLIQVGSASLISLLVKAGMERIRRREFLFRVRLENANREIAELNHKLEDENLRLSHELEIAQHIQSIVLPQEKDYRAFRDLEISCQMLPATEVGGDYYDTIHFGPGGFISIGDVTDHGLHSGLIMMMVHTALRALSNVERDDIQRIFRVINKLLYDFRLKTLDHRIMSLIILKYVGDGDFVATGQHESLLIMRADGSVQDIESLEYGMYAGLDANISPYLKLLSFHLDVDDVLILYTDGVTEAVDAEQRPFGSKGVVDAARGARGGTALQIRTAIVDACQDHLGGARCFDDISVVVIKKTADAGWDGELRGTIHVGDKIEFERDVESSFTMRFIPLDMFDNWQRGGLVSDFTADYFKHNFPSPEDHGLISTVVNELVENAVKFTANNSLPVELTMKKRKDRLLVRATNSVPHHRCEPFVDVCRQLFGRDLDELYAERLAQDAQDRDASGLGLLLIKKDYSSRLGFDFTYDEGEAVQVSVTSELDFAPDRQTRGMSDG